MRTIHIIFLSLLFIAINSLVYFVNEKVTKEKIDLILKDNINSLQTHYYILNQAQKNISYAIYKSVLRNTDAIELLENSYEQSKDIQAKNRENLLSQLKVQYETARVQGILQFQFVFKNNVSFLRVHKPSKFGDNLTDIRHDFKYVNETKKPIRGFVHGRVAHGFRNTFPIFNKKNEHIGAIEISFSSYNYQWYLNEISHIHTHFLVKKDVFNVKNWTLDDIKRNYIQSVEHQNYMLTLGKLHSKKICIDENKIKLDTERELINSKIKTGDAFSIYTNHNDHIEVVSFLPIINLQNEVVAWIVSYVDSPIITATLKHNHIIKTVSFFITLLIIYLLIIQIKAKYKLLEHNKLLDDILNNSDNIMLVTDFKDVKFSNNRFKDIFQIENNTQFNDSIGHNFLSIFIQEKGYLHKGLLKQSENFLSLIQRSKPQNRIVSIMCRGTKTKAFKISISKSHNDEDYLVTLSDITKIKEFQIHIEKQAYTDKLTGIYNRTKFDEIFNDEFSKAKKYKTHLSIALLDIDRFKKFNDTFGHLIGDEVLTQIAKTVNDTLRDSDVLARWGGEEFIILFKETKLLHAKKKVLDIKDKIQMIQHPIAGNITASFGLSEYKRGDTIKSIFKRCDEALYNAKANGRNRVEISV